MPHRVLSRPRRSWLVVVACLAVCLLAPSVASADPSSGGCNSRPNDTPKKLLPCITKADLWRHMQNFQAIADANLGLDGHPSRNSGEPGYLASAKYVEAKMKAAGYDVKLQPYTFTYTSFVGTPTFSETSPTPHDFTIVDEWNAATSNGTATDAPVQSVGGTALPPQSPRVDVITGMIKANVPSRIAFAVSSQTDSRVILDVNGAEALLGQGDMLYKPLGTSKLNRVQGAYISEEETRLIVEACRGQAQPEFEEELLELPSDVEPERMEADEDPVLEEAIRLVAQHQTASVSLMQRRLRVGYTRAGRLIDMLERRGIVSGYEGSKARKVLITEADLPRILGESRPAPEPGEDTQATF